MAHTDVVNLLKRTLDNEKATDLAFSKIAEEINKPAAAE
jgi:ferritin-like metal-binding protein YciE